MWGAIKSDLIDFISTIKEDTSKTLSNVLGDGNENEVSLYFSSILGMIE